MAEIADEDGGTVTHQQSTLPRGVYLRQLAAKLENNVFVLAVVGEFSRGKSSLINALLDRPGLLPTSIEPTTASITVLSYAARAASLGDVARTAARATNLTPRTWPATRSATTSTAGLRRAAAARRRRRRSRLAGG